MITPYEYRWDLMNTHLQDDIEYFFAKKHWQIGEGSMLLAGILPVNFSGLGYFLLSGKLWSGSQDREEILENVDRIEGLWRSDPAHGESATKEEWISWAIAEGYSPKWLQAAIDKGCYVPEHAKEQESDADIGWTGMDPDSPHYSQELDIANQIHRAAENDPSQMPFKKKLAAAQQKLYPKLHITAVRRILNMANPHKRGGRPADEENK